MIEFFLPIIPPTVTHQEKKVTVVNGKPQFYEPPDLKDARQKLLAHLSKHVPDKKFCGAVRLITKWCFPRGEHGNGEYKTTKPDVDNSVKLFLDCCTALGFWTDDAIIASLIIEKFYADIPGIYVRIEPLK